MDLDRIIEGKSVDEAVKMAADRGIQVSREEVAAYMESKGTELSPEQMEKINGGWELPPTCYDG